MPYFKTTEGSGLGQPEIVLYMSDEAHMNPQRLLGFFQESLASGSRFKAGETVQVGWMVTKLVQGAEGSLEVWEPRFETVPIEWTRGVDNTVRNLVLQKSVAELLQVQADFSSLLQAGTVFPSFSERQFTMIRQNPLQNDSGWRFSGRNGERIAGRLQSLFEIACRCPLIIPFLALPPGAVATRGEGVLTVECAGKKISSRDSKLLGDIEQNSTLFR
jgi:hypothetical protein